MKLFLLFILLIISSNNALADDPFALSTEEITKQIIQATKNYANSISCPSVEIDPNLIAALKPYKTSDEWNGGKYAVIWTGDLGCMGGSGSEVPHLSIVTISTGKFVVDPVLSSPIIKFDIPARYVVRVIGNTTDSIILEGIEHGTDDAPHFPSVPIHFKIKTDDKGNWKLISKKTMPAKEAERLLNQVYPSEKKEPVQ